LLQITIRIQAKFHKTGTSTDGWAVEQISRYAEQKSMEDGYAYIQWAITTADDFTEEAKNKAVEKNVRLINGLDFAKMLLNAGIDNIDKAFD